MAEDKFDVNPPDASPIVRIAHTIIQQALNEYASEIQIEPREDKVMVRFRVDGDVEEKMVLPAPVREELVARYKLMADMEVDKHDRPQQGRIDVSHAGRDYQLDARSEPTPQGERMAIAIHEKA